MCLNVILEQKSGRKTGYKILLKTGEKYFTCLSLTKKIELHKKKYVEDTSTAHLLSGDGKTTYLSGFHIFLNKKEAQFISKFYSVVVCRVAFSDETAFGETRWTQPQLDGKIRTKTTKTIVARKCMILEELQSKCGGLKLCSKDFAKQSRGRMVTHHFEEDEHGDIWVVWAEDFAGDKAGRRKATPKEIKTFKLLKENSK